MKSRSTTILTVRHRGAVAVGGDGQVSLGPTIMKADAHKIRRLLDGKVITGFAFALSAARALVRHSQMSAAEIVRESLRISAEIDVYSNANIVVEELPCAT